MIGIDLQKAASFGVAGNFTGHLEQAGEDKDFKNVKTREANAPKALFPTYLPAAANGVPDFLTVFPFSGNSIVFPKGEEKLQIEPECALVCKAVWNGDTVTSLVPFAFAASNDCSIRKEGSHKISCKKNWGKDSKGLADNLIQIDSFTESGILNTYRIASFLQRDGSLTEYGEDSAVRNYSYVYQKLLDWCLEKLNSQADEGPVENIHSYLLASGKPETLILSIGATRYTDFGKTHFLQEKDLSIVMLYPENRYSGEELKEFALGKKAAPADISLLRQRVSLGF